MKETIKIIATIKLTVITRIIAMIINYIIYFLNLFITKTTITIDFTVTKLLLFIKTI